MQFDFVGKTKTVVTDHAIVRHLLQNICAFKKAVARLPCNWKGAAETPNQQRVRACSKHAMTAYLLPTKRGFSLTAREM